MTTRAPRRPATAVAEPAADLAPARTPAGGFAPRYIVQPGHAITPLGGAQCAAGAVVTVADVGAAALPALVEIGAIVPEQPDEE